MSEYHKIQTVYLRDPATKHRTLLMGQYSLPEFEYLAGNNWTYTEKVDGTNIRVIVKDGQVQFGGKTDAAQIPAKLVAMLRNTFDPARLTAQFPDGATLYGEGYGSGIQSGGTYRADQSFVLFDVLVGEWWLQRKSVEDVAAALMLDIVPVVGHGPLNEMIDMVKTGFVSNWGKFTAEGIVARPDTELRTRSGHRVITKIKHKDFR